jgi:hypothetical protein
LFEEEKFFIKVEIPSLKGAKNPLRRMNKK